MKLTTCRQRYWVIRVIIIIIIIIHAWCKKFAYSVVDEEEPGRRVVSTTNATIIAVDSLMRSNRRVMG